MLNNERTRNALIAAWLDCKDWSEKGVIARTLAVRKPAVLVPPDVALAPGAPDNAAIYVWTLEVSAAPTTRVVAADGDYWLVDACVTDVEDLLRTIADADVGASRRAALHRLWEDNVVTEISEGVREPFDRLVVTSPYGAPYECSEAWYIAQECPDFASSDEIRRLPPGESTSDRCGSTVWRRGWGMVYE